MVFPLQMYISHTQSAPKPELSKSWAFCLSITSPGKRHNLSLPVCPLSSLFPWCISSTSDVKGCSGCPPRARNLLLLASASSTLGGSADPAMEAEAEAPWWRRGPKPWAASPCSRSFVCNPTAVQRRAHQPPACPGATGRSALCKSKTLQ